MSHLLVQVVVVYVIAIPAAHVTVGADPPLLLLHTLFVGAALQMSKVTEPTLTEVNFDQC
jgi:hypothetical protein